MLLQHNMLYVYCVVSVVCIACSMFNMLHAQYLEFFNMLYVQYDVCVLCCIYNMLYVKEVCFFLMCCMHKMLHMHI